MLLKAHPWAILNLIRLGFVLTLMNHGLRGAEYKVVSRYLPWGEGTMLERHDVASTEPTPDLPLTITILRVGLASAMPTLHQAEAQSGWRTAKAWAQDEGLRIAMGASMHHADGRSVGFLADDGKACSASSDRYDGFLAFGPTGRDDAAPQRATICDRQDPGFALPNLSKTYRTVLQGPMLIKDGQGLPWLPRRHSASAYGVDRDGNFLFIHCQSPIGMNILIEILTLDNFKIQSAIYADGGTEAALWSGGQDGFPGDLEEVGAATPRSFWCCQDPLNALIRSVATVLYPSGKPLPRVIGIKEKEKAE